MRSFKLANRRQFLSGLLAFSQPATRLLCAQQGPVIPLAKGTELERYRRAQKKVLETFHIRAQSRFLNLRKPALRAHVLMAGQGDPVVMIHGGGAFAAQFAPLLAGLQKQFHVFAPDRPGCGLSDKYDYRGVPFRDHAVDFMSSLLDALGLSKAAVLGNSMGGYWALAFALAMPERVTKLMLLGGAAGSPPPPYPPRPPRTEPSSEATRQTYGILMANGDRAPREILDADSAASSLPGAALSWNTMLEELGREGVDRTGLTYALRPELQNLRPPTLFIWGDKDIEGPPSLAQEMAALAPSARCEVLADAGHLAWLDQPERCLNLVANFVKSGR